MSKLLKFVTGMEFIDTHTHSSDKSYEGEEEIVIARALAAGVSHMLEADVDSSEREAMFSLCRKHRDCLHPMLGLYPGSVDRNWKEELSAVEKYDRTGVVAIGEIGLDYHFSIEFKEEQKEAFRAQLELASSWNLPVNIHLRDATEDFFSIIASTANLHLRGNLHAFSGSAETFRRLSRYGDWYVGIGGVLTFKNAGIAEEIKNIPLDRILLETDAPYLAPTPHRGERNESSLIPVIAEKLAGLKGVSLEEVAEATTKNAKQLFAI